MRELDQAIENGDVANFNEIFDQVLGLAAKS
jgi:hypothetical protein